MENENPKLLDIKSATTSLLNLMTTWKIPPTTAPKLSKLQ